MSSDGSDCVLLSLQSAVQLSIVMRHTSEQVESDEVVNNTSHVESSASATTRL